MNQNFTVLPSVFVNLFFNFGISKDFFKFFRFSVSISHFQFFGNGNLFFLSKASYFTFFRFLNKVNRLHPSIYLIRLFLKGVGYKILRSKLKSLRSVYRFELGFSVSMYVFVPGNVFSRHRREKLVLFSPVKDHVTRFARFIIGLRTPDVYKGKGVRDAAYVFQPKPGKQRLFIIFMPVSIGKSQILFNSQKGSFVLHFTTIFGIGKSTTRWALSHLGLSVSSRYSDAYRSGPVSREHVLNKLFRSYKNYPYFVFGRELHRLRLMRRKKFLASNQIKSLRMRGGLPIWGQRTRSNAKTAFRVFKR